MGRERFVVASRETSPDHCRSQAARRLECGPLRSIANDVKANVQPLIDQTLHDFQRAADPLFLVHLPDEN